MMMMKEVNERNIKLKLYFHTKCNKKKKKIHSFNVFEKLN